MSIYPNAIDGFEQLPLIIDGITPVNAFSVNNLRRAILNIESELGIDPSGSYDTVRARLDALEVAPSPSTSVDFQALELRVANLEGIVGALANDISIVNNELGNNPSGGFTTVGDRLDYLEGASTSLPLTLLADSNLSLGNLLIVNSSGNAELADSNGSTVDNARVIGSSSNNYLIGDTAEIYSVPGKLMPVKFFAAPIASNNGRPVYLSTTPGIASMIPPTIANSTIFLLGILQGADGVTTTPNILFQPTVIASN